MERSFIQQFVHWQLSLRCRHRYGRFSTLGACPGQQLWLHCLVGFGLFYGGFGAIITPLFGVREAYGEDIASYNNALGFWVLSKLNDGLKSN